LPLIEREQQEAVAPFLIGENRPCFLKLDKTKQPDSHAVDSTGDEFPAERPAENRT
jgi:hypothetical protein